MESDSDIKYVGLHTGSTLGYQKKISSRYRINLQQRVVGEVTLLPMIQWYDSTHIATVEHYRNFVFGRERLTKGNFIEADLGQKQLQSIQQCGMEAHVRLFLRTLQRALPRPVCARASFVVCAPLIPVF